MWEPNFTKFPEHAITRGVLPFQIKDEWYMNIRFVEGFGAEGLHDNGRAIFESPHVNFTRCAWMIWTMSLAIDRHRTSTADSFTTIRIKRDWFFAAFDQALVNDIEHFEERRVR